MILLRDAAIAVVSLVLLAVFIGTAARKDMIDTNEAVTWCADSVADAALTQGADPQLVDQSYGLIFDRCQESLRLWRAGEFD
jgi:hypothetical protein